MRADHSQLLKKYSRSLLGSDVFGNLCNTSKHNELLSLGT